MWAIGWVLLNLGEIILVQNIHTIYGTILVVMIAQENGGVLRTVVGIFPVDERCDCSAWLDAV